MRPPSTYLRIEWHRPKGRYVIRIKDKLLNRDYATREEAVTGAEKWATDRGLHVNRVTVQCDPPRKGTQ